MKKVFALAAAAVVTAMVGSASADVITGWTFEGYTVVATPGTTSDSVAADVGAGHASGVHAASTTAWSTPAGNGSAKSFSSTAWAVGDYYQFQVSTAGFKDISITFDQTSSNTGPRDFVVQYSTDGTSFTQFGNQYSLLANATVVAPASPVRSSWSPAAGVQSLYSFSNDLSSLTALNDASAVYIRLVDNSTTSANAGVVAAGGTDRVDNFQVVGTVVPEPTTLALLGVAGLLAMRRSRKA